MINHEYSREHNQLLGLDGGTTDEYYHLTSSQHSEITTFFASTDITASEAETLTDTSLADSLHTHNTIKGIEVINTPSFNGAVLTADSGLTTAQWKAQGIPDHGSLTGLGGDDHTQYVLLAGRAGNADIGTGPNRYGTLYGQNANMNGSVALTIQANSYAFAVGSNSGLFFSTSNPRAIELHLGGTFKHRFGMGSSNDEGLFYHLPRTTAPNDTTGGNMYVHDNGDGTYTLKIRNTDGSGWVNV